MEKRLFVPQELIPTLITGAKTMHRVVLKPQPDEKYTFLHGVCTSSIDDKNVGRIGFGPSDVLVKQFIKLPFQVGDLCWVPEAWCIFEAFHIIDHKLYAYKADCPSGSEGDECRKYYISLGYPYQWRSSATMPKSAARIWLEVTGTKVERLRSITEEDAEREGLIDLFVFPNTCTAREKFTEIWNYYAKLGHDWNANDWVQVLELRRVER